MSKTVVGLFSATAQAEQVKSALATQGFSHATVVANNTTGEDSTESIGLGQRISHFFSSLTGGDDDVHEHYAAGVNSGGALLAVTVDDTESTEVAALLKQHGARDIDGNTAAADAGTPVYGASTSTTAGATAIPIVEEALVVGKREVDRGGVRVYSHLVERPVSADINLRDEFINVERRTVDRPATAADFAAGTAGTIELNATGEEAVVGKTSRVVEEVLVGKNSAQHTENIQDSVRKTEVEVEEIPAQAVTYGTRS